MVIVTMSGNVDYEKKDPELYIIGRLSTRSFYRDILIERHGYVPSVEITQKEIEAGPLDNTLLRKIDVDGIELFAKIYTPRKKSKTSVTVRSLKDNVDYQFSHTKFWNECGISSPRLYAVINEFAESDQVAALIFEYWNGPTHDVDVIAINDLLKRKRKVLDDKDRFLSEHERAERLPREIGILESLLDETVRSTLSTIRNLQIIGTEGYSVYDVRTDVLSRRDYLNKLIHYLTYAMLWHKVNTGEFDFSRAREWHSDSEIKNNVLQLQEDIKNSSDFLLKVLTDRDRYVYTHGDAYWHHFIRRRVDGKVNIGVIDSDHVMLAIPELDITKPLASYLTDFDYDRSTEYYLSLWEKQDKVPDIFDLVMLFESLTLMGKRAKVHIEQRDRHDLMVNKAVGYHPTFAYIEGLEDLQFPETVSFREYDANIAIPRLQRRIIERFERIIERQTCYTIQDDRLNKIKQLFETLLRYNILYDD